MLCILLPDERLHKSAEGAGPGQCGRAAECSQVSQSLGQAVQLPFQTDANADAVGGQKPGHQS